MANININLGYRSVTSKVQGVSTSTYKDLGTSNMKLLYELKNNKQVVTLYDKNTTNIDLYAIKSSLNNLFSFYPGQEILDPAFGNTLYKYIYQPINGLTQDNLRRQIKQMINKYQPRIQLTDIRITNDLESMLYTIILIYNIPALNISSKQSISISSEGIKFA